MAELPVYVQKIDNLNQIILGLYSNTTKGTAKYIHFLEELQGILYFDFGNILFFLETKDGYELESFCQIGWDKYIEEIYLSTYYKEDDVFPIFAKKSPVIMRSSDMFDETRTISTYYKSFMESAGFDRSLECNIILPTEINSYGICSLFRKIPKQDFNYEEKKLFEFLQPHLSNRARLDRINKDGVHHSVGMNSNFLGTIVLNKDGDIQYISETFKKILLKRAKQKNLQECVKEIIHLMDNIDQYNFKEALHKLNNIPGMIEILPLENKNGQTGSFYCNLYDMSSITNACLKRLEKKYQMTSTEIKTLEGIIQGKKRSQIAKELYVSMPSVKKGITSIYRKLNINTQMQLLVKLGIIENN